VNEAGFIFFTNYNSFKGKQLTQNPKACLVIFWRELERQVRVTGMVEKIAGKDSDEYFNSRPEGSRIGALASPQSQVIESRQWLDDHYNNLTKQMEGSNIQRPHFWGGYIVKPAIVEFWQGRPNRLHDRLQYRIDENNVWRIERLAP
jgi:pyridoxamine 5'-phosphate oxidase